MNHFFRLDSRPGLLTKLGSLIKDKRISAVIDGSTLQLITGKETTEMDIGTIREVNLFLKNKPQPIALKTFRLDFESKEYDYLSIQSRDSKVYTLPARDFDAAAFGNFLKLLQNRFVELTETFDEKIDKIYKKCEVMLMKDRKLENEFRESMSEAYKSVYEAYTLDRKRSDAEQVLQSPSVVFYHLTTHNYYYYYLRNNFKQGMKKESIDIAESLIQTAMRNLGIVQARMDFYKNIQVKLLQLKEEHKQRLQEEKHKAHLRKVADRLNHLQQQNMKQDINVSNENQEILYDTQVLNQLDKLADNIMTVDTLEQSYMLKEHLNLFQQTFGEHESALKELNDMLSRGN